MKEKEKEITAIELLNDEKEYDKKEKLKSIIKKFNLNKKEEEKFRKFYEEYFEFLINKNLIIKLKNGNYISKFSMKDNLV